VLPALTRVLAARGDSQAAREGHRLRPARAGAGADARTGAAGHQGGDNYGRHVQGLRVASIVGGVPYGAQLKALRGPLDILIATPGRLMDHMATGKAVLANVEMLVLDEADRMLDMGFIDDIHHIAQALPAQRQTVMYSATFGGHVGRLARPAARPAAHRRGRRTPPPMPTSSSACTGPTTCAHKNALLDHILTERSVDQALVFTSTQRDADWLADRLAEMGHAVASLHGGMPQGRRNRVLQGLRRKHLRVLVATDVAARGIDVPTISHVINYGLPMKAEDYVHRIGRTGRAGRSGLAVTLAERRDFGMIQRIQRFTTQRIPSATIARPRAQARRRQARARPAGFGGRPAARAPVIARSSRTAARPSVAPSAGPSTAHRGGRARTAARSPSGPRRPRTPAHDAPHARPLADPPGWPGPARAARVRLRRRAQGPLRPAADAPALKSR
jgi:superfamily II DNA/RNA helicase